MFNFIVIGTNSIESEGLIIPILQYCKAGIISPPPPRYITITTRLTIEAILLMYTLSDCLLLIIAGVYVYSFVSTQFDILNIVMKDH